MQAAFIVSKLDEQVIAPRRDDIPFRCSEFRVSDSELPPFFSELRTLNSELKTPLSPQVIEASVVSKLDEQAVLAPGVTFSFAAVPGSEIRVLS